ncbi:LysR family transcriptional regulator [Vulgatibacter sp.]|uniref:LysR family transcriptional regulator n=1 Tax=Vulgatibacter sp. TaxID=1971226 RepID=UPI0035690012
MDLKEVAVFVQVVRSGSFTAAARELEMQKSSVSRKVAELEASLGARLLQRTTRTLHLTDEGRIFYEHGQRALAELEEAELALGGMRAEPRGLLRVTAPLSFGFVGPIVAAFLGHYPEVQVEMVCTDRVVDLVEEGFDVAIRAGRLPDTSLIARKLGHSPRFLVASRSYLKGRARPRKPEDLAGHTCLTFGSQHAVWRLASGERSAEVKVEGKLAANDYDLIREAAIAGGGIALVPELGCTGALREGKLERLLPAWTSEETPIHALYPSTRHLAAKVKAFVAFLQARMR